MANTPEQAASKSTAGQPVGRKRTMAKIAAYWAIYHLVFWHGMFLYEFFQYKAAVVAGTQSSLPFTELYFQAFGSKNLGFLLCSALMFPIIAWDILKFTQSYYGPVVAFKRTLEGMKSGKEVPRVRLRKKDSLIDLQDAFNEYLEVYHQRRELRQHATPESSGDHIVRETASAQVIVKSSPQSPGTGSLNDTIYETPDSQTASDHDTEAQLLEMMAEIHEQCESGTLPGETLKLHSEP